MIARTSCPNFATQSPFACLLAAVAAVCGLVTAAEGSPPAQFGFNTVATGFTQPICFAYAPDGRIFVAERGGVVKIVRTSGTTTTFLDMRTQVNAAWGRGIVSIAVDPNFAANKRIYMLYHEELAPNDPDQGGSARWRLVRVVPQIANPNLADLSTMTTLASDLETTGFKADPHSGGDIDFDLGGNLLATFGDGATPTGVDPEALKTFDLARLHGKMIRIDPTTGNGVPTNPFYEAANPGSNRSKILARGLRQPFRITVDATTGTIYEGDVGWDTWERLNIISTTWTNPWRDQNMGWPCYEGGSGALIVQPLYAADGRTSPTCKDIQTAGARPSAYAYAHNGQGAAIILGKVYRGSSYPGSFLGKVFWADHNRDEVHTYTPGGGVALFGTAGGWGSIVDFELAPNGNLAYLSYNEGRIREITYLGTNRAPVANASATFVPGTQFRYTLSAAGSSDPDGDPLGYAWDFGDGTKGAGPSVAKTYPFGSYDVLLTVTDSKGAAATKALHVDAGNRPPAISFRSPTNDSAYAVGDLVRFEIDAVDPEDGPLPGDKIIWQVILLHNAHSHPGQPAQGLTGRFTADFPELVETFYEVKATARDGNGGTATTSLFIRGKMVDVAFASSPAGASLIIDGTTRATPYTQRFIVNSTHTVSAPAGHVSGGNSFTFQSWTNGAQTIATRDLGFVVPASARTLRAKYVLAPATWKRTVIFILGQTTPGQDMFIRGGIDHGYANANLGRHCETTNHECALPIRHLNLRNQTTAPWKANDGYLDWYGPEAAQSANSVGSPADWTTNAWPAEWGPSKTVAADGFGVEPANHWGPHYWMLDVEMDCSRTVNGWFEVKSFISGGPGWEPDVAQPGAPYVSGNHFGKCGEMNMFKRGSNTWEHWQP